MMQIWWAIVLLGLLGFVSYKAARYYKQRRFGYAVGMTVLSLVIAYQVVARLYGPPPPAMTPPGNTPAVEEAQDADE